MRHLLHQSEMSKERWIPLEANPDVLNKYAGQLGLDTRKISFCDIISLNEVGMHTRNASK